MEVAQVQLDSSDCYNLHFPVKEELGTGGGRRGLGRRNEYGALDGCVIKTGEKVGPNYERDTSIKLQQLENNQTKYKNKIEETRKKKRTRMKGREETEE